MCELSPVTFYGDTIFCVTIENQPFSPVKPIVENIGISWQGQQAKLSANKERWGVKIILIPSESGDQETLCLPVRKLPAFLASINPKKVRPELRERIELYQAECDDALWNYWINGRAERHPEPASNPDTFPGTLSITPSTVADRQPLRSLVNAWSQVSGQPFNVCWNQLKAAFRLTNIKDLPQEWIPDAIDWVQAKIDALPKGLPAGTVGNVSTVAAVPGNPSSPGSKPLPLPAPLPEAATEEYARRAAALAELEREALKWECDARDRFRELQRRYSDLTGSAFSTLLNRVPVRSFVSTDFMVDVLAGQFGNAYRGMDTAFQDVQYAIRAAIAANRVLAASV